MKITTEPRSDQFNADDFIVGSKTFTIADAKAGSAEQKYDILLEGQTRFWRPPLTVLRILTGAWGDESDDWIGRRVTLYRDETIKFGSEVPGGIRLSHMSHLPGNKTFTIKLASSRGKKQTWRVEPLPDAPPPSGAITKLQLQQLAALITKAGFENDDNGRADWLAYASNVVARPVNGTKELTTSEAALVIADMEKKK